MKHESTTKDLAAHEVRRLQQKALELRKSDCVFGHVQQVRRRI